jgi:SAM-dependent methyltransferase
MERAFTLGTFTAPPARRTPLVREVVRRLGPESKARILDLGCGSGTDLLAIASALPRVRLTGIDTSVDNVSSARERVEQAGLADRLTFEVGDYLETALGPFELIMSDSVLQNVDATDDALYTKLAGDLAPRGWLIASMPFDCPYNRLLWIMRRVLRRFQGPRTDRLLLRLARLLHPGWDAALLAERVPYMYLLPHRLDGAMLRSGLSSRGFVLLESATLPHTSLGQPRHRLSVFRKREAG